MKASENSLFPAGRTGSPDWPHPSRGGEVPAPLGGLGRRALLLRYPDSGLQSSPPPSQSLDQWPNEGLSPDTVALPSPILTGFPQLQQCNLC